jgi:hypothetical protein
MDRPVRPRGRLDEGSVALFSIIDRFFRWPSSTLRRAPRRLFGVPEGCLYVQQDP